MERHGCSLTGVDDTVITDLFRIVFKLQSPFLNRTVRSSPGLLTRSPCKLNFSQALTQSRNVNGARQSNFPKFRYVTDVQIAPDLVNPIIFEKEELNFDAHVNNGVFICMEPGFYTFSFGLGAIGDVNRMGAHLMLNSQSVSYAES